MTQQQQQQMMMMSIDGLDRNSIGNSQAEKDINKKT
jgi:hypothetical protein